MDSIFELRLFGPPRLLRDGAPVQVRRRKTLAVMAYAAMSDCPVTRERVGSLLWPDNDAAHALASLRLVLHELNTVAPLLEVTGDQLRFRHELCTVDAAEFYRDARVTDARCADDGITIDERRRLAALYQDDFLRGFSIRGAADFDDWQFFTAEALQSRLKSLLTGLVEHHVQTDTSIAIEYAQRLLRIEELDEDLHRALIELYITEGRFSAAVRQFDRCREVLAHELGERPSSDLVELVDRVRGCIESPADECVGSDYLRHAGPGLDGGNPGRERAAREAAVPSRLRSRIPPLAAIATLAAAVLIIGFSRLVDWLPARHPRIPTIAVVPLSYSGLSASRETLAEYIARYLETNLVNESGLAVRRAEARPNQRTPVALRRYAREHRIDYLIDGAIVDHGNEIVASVQVVDVRNSSIVYATEFHVEESDLGTELTVLASDITEYVYRALGPEMQDYLMSGEVLLNPFCETAYLLTSYHQERDLTTPVRNRLYLTIMENLVDPYVCEGYFKNADVYWAVGMYGIMPPREAGELLRVSLEQGGTRVDSPYRDLAQGIHSLLYELDAGAAARSFGLAYHANPTSMEFARWYSVVLSLAGEYDAALDVLSNAVRFSPHDPVVPIYRSTYLYKAGRYEEALDAAQISIDRNNRWIGLTQRGKALIQLGRVDEAIIALEEATTLQRTMQEPKAFLAYAYALAGNDRQARALRASIRNFANDDPSGARSAALAAVIELAVDDRAAAVGWIEQAIEERDPQLWLMIGDPVLAGIQDVAARQLGIPAGHELASGPR